MRQLRQWIDDPKPMGLPKEAENLVIMIYAAQTNQSFYQHGGPYSDASLTKIPDSCELRKEDLPEPSDWEAALKRAGSIFGVAGLKLLSAANVNTLSAQCKQKATAMRRACQIYVQRLKQRMMELGIPPDNTDRVKTATATQALVDKLFAVEDNAVVKTLVSSTIATSETAMGECASKAAELEGNLDTAGWQTFELIRKLPEEHQAAAQRILADLVKALSSDEHVLELAPALKAAQSQAMRLLEKVVEQPKSTDSKPPGDPPVKKPDDKAIIERDFQANLTLAAAQGLLADLEKKQKEGKSLRIEIHWVLKQGGDA